MDEIVNTMNTISIQRSKLGILLWFATFVTNLLWQYKLKKIKQWLFQKKQSKEETTRWDICSKRSWK